MYFPPTPSLRTYGAGSGGTGGWVLSLLVEKGADRRGLENVPLLRVGVQFPRIQIRLPLMRVASHMRIRGAPEQPSFVPSGVQGIPARPAS